MDRDKCQPQCLTQHSWSTTTPSSYTARSLNPQIQGRGQGVMPIFPVRTTEARQATRLSEAAGRARGEGSEGQPGVCSSEGLPGSSASSCFLSRGSPALLLPQHPCNPAEDLLGVRKGEACLAQKVTLENPAKEPKLGAAVPQELQESRWLAREQPRRCLASSLAQPHPLLHPTSCSRTSGPTAAHKPPTCPPLSWLISWTGQAL